MGANYRNQDLTGQTLTGNLRGADFFGANLTNVVLDGCDLTGANLSGVTWTGASLTAAKLPAPELAGTDYDGAETSAAIIAGVRPAIDAGAMILPLGDSITQGAGSSATNGYRRGLWQHAEDNTYDINLVGPRTNGDFPDNQHAGFSGSAINGIVAQAELIIGPGKVFEGVAVIIFLAGTNNMGAGSTAFSNPGTMDLYASRLEDLHDLEPDAVIVVSTIPPINAANFPTPAANVDTFNAALPAIWDAFDTAHPGSELVRWNANAALGGVWDADNFDDDFHPNDTGYGLMLNDATHGLLAAIDPVLAAL